LNGDPRLDFLRTTGRERLSRLSALCIEQAKPFGHFYTAEAPFDWYETY
jgi:hypothetical protein